MSQPLRIAVPNKGTLADPASQMLAEAGYRERTDTRELVLTDAENDTEFFFLRPGTSRSTSAPAGSTSASPGRTCSSIRAPLRYPSCSWASAPRRSVSPVGRVLPHRSMTSRALVSPPRIPGIVSAHLAAKGVEARVIRLDGAVETAVRLEVADVIADVVSTGTTLRNAGLEVFGDPLLVSQAVLVRRTGAPESARVDQLVRRLQGVIIARRYVLMDYDIRDDLVEKAVAITPGIESPTVAPLHEPGWSAVRSMVPSRDTNRIMDELWELGARGILVTSIHACRL